MPLDHVKFEFTAAKAGVGLFAAKGWFDNVKITLYGCEAKDAQHALQCVDEYFNDPAGPFKRNGFKVEVATGSPIEITVTHNIKGIRTGPNNDQIRRTLEAILRARLGTGAAAEAEVANKDPSAVEVLKTCYACEFPLKESTALASLIKDNDEAREKINLLANLALDSCITCKDIVGLRKIVEMFTANVNSYLEKFPDATPGIFRFIAIPGAQLKEQGAFFVAARKLNTEDVENVLNSWCELFKKIADQTKPPPPERKPSL